MTTESRKPRDVRGHVLPLRFKVIDNRPPVPGAAAAQAAAEAAAGQKVGRRGAGGGPWFACWQYAGAKGGCYGRKRDDALF